MTCDTSHSWLLEAKNLRGTGLVPLSRACEPSIQQRKMTLDKIRQLALPACREFNVKRLDVFGSFARSRRTDASDIDLLVEFRDPEHKPSKRFFGLLHQFEDVFQCNVDLLTVSGLRNPFFRDRVMKQRINIYGGSRSQVPPRHSGSSVGNSARKCHWQLVWQFGSSGTTKGVFQTGPAGEQPVPPVRG